MFKEVDNAFNWMVSFTNLEKKPDLTKRGYRLDKMKHLLTLFNNPERDYKILHVAGSKGKGSTCGFLGSILTEAGYKAGIYSSPHLLDYRERITNNHNFFRKESYLAAINSVKETLSNIDHETFPGGEPTTFELMTLVAFIIFRDEKCDWVVLETGLGGRLDSTNVVNPVASIITPIELEHQELLGDTLEAIAFEKAGIIKENSRIFTSNSKDIILKVLKDRAEKLNSSIYIISSEYRSNITTSGTFLEYRGTNYKLGLEGDIQAENALLAIMVIENVLPNIPQMTISKGLEKTTIPGRFQKISENPTIILDGAHTKESVKRATNTFNTLYGAGTLIFGAIAGKDIKSMAIKVKKYFPEVIISTPGTFKKSNLEDVALIFRNYGVKVEVISSPKQALSLAKKIDKPILVTGSFYMAGEIAKLLTENE